MARPRSVPTYRLHRQSGQALVTLTDGLGGRRDVLLGKYNSVASRVEHARLVAEWEAGGRSLLQPAAPAIADLSMNELLLRYWKHAEAYYGFNGERGDEGCFRSALRIVRENYGHTKAKAFGPLALKACRQKMVDAGWSRNYCNAQVDRIRRMFRWAAEEQLLPGSLYAELKAVAGLRRGKTEAHETAKVKPANPDHVEAALPFMPSPVQGIVRFQQFTGCRPAEACALRAVDLDMSDARCWVYRPGSDQGTHGDHKTAHHGHDRLILIGPRAQEVVRAHLKIDLHAYLFCPKDAAHERNAKVKARAKEPGKRKYKRKAKPRRAPGDRYTVRVYSRAISRACRLANVPAWGPNRLRHSRATELRPYGLDVVKTVLGHSKVETSQVYAEKDFAAAMDLMAKIG
jgi:integrase